MKDTDFGPDNVDQAIILGDGETIITELAFHHEVNIDDLDEIQQITKEQKETEEWLRANAHWVSTENFPKKRTFIAPLDFQKWLQDEFKDLIVHKFF
jgi:hydroxymethylpyrimidine pyrophosphatase-like HAD family hydrolase